MITELGIWSHTAGYIIESGIYSQDEGAKRIARFVSEGDDEADDLSCIPVCPIHPDQPACDCAGCEPR